MIVETPEPDDNDDQVVDAAIEIVRSEAENVNVESIFTYAMKVGTMLIVWRKMMDDGGFSQGWVERAGMTLFEKFFTPFVPDFSRMGDDDDD